MRALFHKPKHRKSRFLVKSGALVTALLLSAGVGVTVSAPAFADSSSGKTNSASYWEGQFDHPASCYKHDGNSEHGTVTNGGKAVTLYTFNQSWPGDHWEALIVKGGSVDNGSGPGNVVYTHPSAGTPYLTPLNAGGQQSDVSHWIVCKGTTPTPPQLVASASVQVAPATCDVGEVASVGAMVNATLTSSSGTTGPGAYEFLFGASANAKFAGNQSTLLLAGSLSGPLTGPECDPPFNWDWEYAAPTCTALTVVYPGNIPSGQANDVNIKFTYGPGFSQTKTLNFHNNGGTWSGTKVFNYADHPDFASITGKYRVTWVQVAGTNYHWQGIVECGEDVIPKDATAGVSVTPATCDSAGVANFTITNASWDGPAVLNNGIYTRTATADAGHQFSDGTTSAVVTYQLEDILNPNAPPCYTPPTVVTPVIEFTSGTCFAVGEVSAVETDTYGWTVSGPQSARVYTAVPKGNVVLTQTVFGPYDTRIINYKDAECQPSFTVEQGCGYVKITYHNNSKWDRWPDFRFTGDGVVGVDHGSGLTYTNVKVAAGTSMVIFEKTFDEDYNGGSVDVWYQDILGAERDIDTAAVKLAIKTDCEVNVLPADPQVSIVGTCGAALVSVSNPFTPAENTIGTDATFTVKVDGVVVDTITVRPGEVVDPLSYTFGEDTGDHVVEVFSEDELIGSAVVSSDCEPTLITTFKAPTSSDVCGIDNDKLNIPKDTDEVSYKITKDTRVKGVGSVTVEAVAVDGYQFKDGEVTSWTFQFTNKPCPPKLATTGAEVGGFITAGVALLLLGGGFITAAMIRRRKVA